MEKNFLLPAEKWQAVKLVYPHIVYHFDPDEWGLEFLADGKVTIYLEGDPAGTYPYTFRDGMLAIGDEPPEKTEILDSFMILHGTDRDDGSPHYILYKRLHGDSELTLVSGAAHNSNGESPAE